MEEKVYCGECKNYYSFIGMFTPYKEHLCELVRKDAFDGKWLVDKGAEKKNKKNDCKDFAKKEEKNEGERSQTKNKRRWWKLGRI